MATEDLLREILSVQNVQNEKIDAIATQQKDIRADVRETRDSMIRVDEWRKGHMRAHGWISRSIWAIASAIALGIITGTLRMLGVL